MTQTRPEACTCRDQPVWCDACLESGFARAAPWDDHAMLVPSVHAALKAENARLLCEVAMLRATLIDRDGTQLCPRCHCPSAELPCSRCAAIEADAFLAALADQQHTNEPDPDAPTQAAPFPAHALRQRHQAIGLLCTADAGRVRLGGYAPTLPR